MVPITAPICLGCKHLRRDTAGDPDMTEEGDFVCTAYPEGIPAEIILSEVDHKKPYKGDRGIQYEPLDQ